MSTTNDWKEDPSADERWNAGVDFAMVRFCHALGVDPKSVNWDAATETVEGDVSAVIGNILRAKLGEEWSPEKGTVPGWLPIETMTEQDRYGDGAGFLLVAPELVDEDCNVHGVGMGYYQDERDVPCGPDGAVREPGVDYGGWLACKWSMSSDEWREVPVTPTHYMRITGP